ncbi:UNVERIFIED_CONTAM: hypothetical protein GTU68_033072 [Idotea baltica]|nr:hypothetical protein [Idotea baltica]
MHKHTGERPHSCSLCHARFTEKISLVRHMRTHTGEKPYACPSCSRSFAYKLTLNNHFDKFHRRQSHQGSYAPSLSQ